jgi:hypothetical protein
MANNFILILDTTPPLVTVTLPSSVGKNDVINILVSSDEALMNYQDFYFVDSLKNRLNCTLNLSEDSKVFSGSVDLTGLESGIITFFYSVKDEVGNVTSSTRAILVEVTSRITFSAKSKISGFNTEARDVSFEVKERQTGFIT